MIAASIHYMHKAIPTCLPAGGVPNPSEAIAAFKMTFPTADEARVLKDFHLHWESFIRAIQMQGGLDVFCAEYRKGLSPAEKAGWDRLKKDAADMGRNAP